MSPPRSPLRLVAVAAACLSVLVLVSTPAAAATAPAEGIFGGGSTWSQIAVDQWRADVRRQGLVVNYQGTGSTQGRVQFIAKTYDFAVSEIPFQSRYVDATGNAVDEVAALNGSGRTMAYMPIVAGGTSFMYHVEVGGQLVRDLRLSKATIAGIFTGRITNWNDARITADNAGRALPGKSIRPVIRSDGSGTSAQFTAYLANQTPAEWNAFCARASISPPCPALSIYPKPPGFAAEAKAGSDGVAGAVAASYGDGSITYVEYGYAVQRGYPVASVLNAAGFYAQPSSSNVAIALTQARINGDRTQDLRGVYANRDARAYPLSSYSYMIVPTNTATPFNVAKGQTLGRFIRYFLCEGQQKAAQLGYSPLPPNLVRFGFEAAALVPGAAAPPKLDYANCPNPFFRRGAGNPLDEATTPPRKDRASGRPTGRATAARPTGRAAVGARPGQGAGTSAPRSASAAARATAASAITGAATAGGNAVDPVTGEVLATDLAAQAVGARPTTLSPGPEQPGLSLGLLAAAQLVLAVLAPPLITGWLRSRRRRSG